MCGVSWEGCWHWWHQNCKAWAWTLKSTHFFSLSTKLSFDLRAIRNYDQTFLNMTLCEACNKSLCRVRTLRDLKEDYQWGYLRVLGNIMGHSLSLILHTERIMCVDTIQYYILFPIFSPASEWRVMTTLEWRGTRHPSWTRRRRRLGQPTMQMGQYWQQKLRTRGHF